MQFKVFSFLPPIIMEKLISVCEMSDQGNANGFQEMSYSYFDKNQWKNGDILNGPTKNAKHKCPS